MSPARLRVLTLSAALLGALTLALVLGIGTWTRGLVKPLSRSKVMETW